MAEEIAIEHEDKSIEFITLYTLQEIVDELLELADEFKGSTGVSGSRKYLLKSCAYSIEKYIGDRKE